MVSSSMAHAFEKIGTEGTEPRFVASLDRQMPDHGRQPDTLMMPQPVALHRQKNLRFWKKRLVEVVILTEANEDKHVVDVHSTVAMERSRSAHIVD